MLLYDRQKQQKKYYDRKCKVNKQVFKNKEKVLIKTKLSDKNWKPGTILSESKIRPRSYNVQINNGNILSRNRHFISSYPKYTNYNNFDSDDDSTLDSQNDTENNVHIQSPSKSDDDVVFIPNVTKRGRVVKVPDRFKYNY